MFVSNHACGPDMFTLKAVVMFDLRLRFDDMLPFSKKKYSGSCGSHGMNESKLVDQLLNGSEYVPTYEDKDGDWMLVGDVPWQ
jgi:hypothetical protein